jgi:hypothetical protein
MRVLAVRAFEDGAVALRRNTASLLFGYAGESTRAGAECWMPLEPAIADN